MFRANRKMQLLPFLKKDPRYWGLNSTVYLGCLGPRSFLCASVPKAQDQIPRRALETGRSSLLSQPPRLSPPCRASAHHLQTRRGEARREALPQPDPPRAGLCSRCLCVPATRLEALGAEPPASSAEPQILTFPSVFVKCAHSPRPLTEARESALRAAFQAARSDKLAPR